MQNSSSQTIQTERSNTLKIKVKNTGKKKLKNKKKVNWDETAIDNENMNKKSSKVCCIYKKEGDDSDEECDLNAYERCPKHKNIQG